MSYNYVTTENLEDGVLEDAVTVRPHCGFCGKAIGRERRIKEFAKGTVLCFYCGCKQHKMVLWKASNDTDHLDEYRLCCDNNDKVLLTQYGREEFLDDYEVDWAKYRSENVFVLESGMVVLTGTDSGSSLTEKLLKLRFNEEMEKLLMDYYKKQKSEEA